MPTLIDRIENWARAQRSSKSTGRAHSIESEYRNSYHGDRSDHCGSISTIDYVDAARVNDAWKRCEPRARDLLKWHYVFRASAGRICREFDIKHSPPHVFEYEMYRARGELATQLEALDVLFADFLAIGS